MVVVVVVVVNVVLVVGVKVVVEVVVVVVMLVLVEGKWWCAVFGKNLVALGGRTSEPPTASNRVHDFQNLTEKEEPTTKGCNNPPGVRKKFRARV